MSGIEQNNAAKPPIKGFDDILTAREAARIFSRQGVAAKHLLAVAERLQVSGVIGRKVVAGLMDIFPEIEAAGRTVVLHLAASFVLGAFKAGEKIDDNLIKGLSLLLNYSDVSVRERALKILLVLGPQAVISQDFALGCIRNADPQIRLGGAQLLHSLGTACSRSLVRQIRVALEKYPQDEEFCRLLNETMNLLNSMS